MQLARLVEASVAAAATKSRKQKIAALAQCIAAMTPDEAEIGVAMLSGAPRQGKVGLGYAAVREVEAPGALEHPTVTLQEADERLSEIATTSGPGSGRRRKELWCALLVRCTTQEQDFLVRLLLGSLRQGALEGIVVDAIAGAAEIKPAVVRRALMLSGDLSRVAHAALHGGADALSRFSLELFRPLQPMLAQTSETLKEALDSFDDASVEFKLDGARIQVHRDGDRVEVYTRKLNVVTPAVPEVVELARALPAERIILDGEVIALMDDGTPRPFQETMRRFGRKLDVESMRAEIPLTAQFFDCLLIDDQTLVDASTLERWAALEGAAPSAAVIPHLRTPGIASAQTLLDRALGLGHEGIMVKSAVAAYEAGRRGAGWRKVKPSHTLDLVVLAAEWGSGRRKGWLSNLHLGARDPKNGAFVMLGKTFKGLTDVVLQWQTEELQKRQIGDDAWTVYVRPELVVEIAFNNVQASPHYPGGMALRFARVKRYRPDKQASEADTIDTIRRIFHGGSSAC